MPAFWPATAIFFRIGSTCSSCIAVTRALTFAVQAHDDRGVEVGRGTIHRVVVDADRRKLHQWMAKRMKGGAA